MLSGISIELSNNQLQSRRQGKFFSVEKVPDLDPLKTKSWPSAKLQLENNRTIGLNANCKRYSRFFFSEKYSSNVISYAALAVVE